MISIYADGIPAKCHDDALMFALYPSTQNKEMRAVAMAPAYLQKNTDPAVDAWISEGNSDACTGPRAGYIANAAQRKTTQEELQAAVLAQWEAKKL